MTTNDENANAVGNQIDVHTGKRKDYDSNYTARRKDNKVLKNGIGDVSQADIDKQKEHVEKKREYNKQHYARQKANILKQIASGEGSSQHATAATNVTPRVAILVERVEKKREYKKQLYYDSVDAAIKAKNGVNAFRIAAKQGDLEVLKVFMKA
nr:ankyrin repeat-containing protein At5g02620-like [Tanacetum cinerariifolium]